MANEKISELPVVSTGTVVVTSDKLPIVNGSETKAVIVDNLFNPYIVIDEESIAVKGKNVSVGDAEGGTVELVAGAGSGDGSGGNIELNAGFSGLSASATGGNIIISSGIGVNGGGDINMETGAALSGPGGNFNLTAGEGASGGEIRLTGGDGSSGDGGDIVIQAGQSSGGDDGNVKILNLPTSDPNVVGALYVTAGALMVSAG